MTLQYTVLKIIFLASENPSKESFSINTKLIQLIKFIIFYACVVYNKNNIEYPK